MGSGMKTTSQFRRATLAVLSVSVALRSVVLAATAPPASAQSGVTTRPISDFLNVQATFCVPPPDAPACLFIPPFPNVLGWTTPFPPSGTLPERLALVDYAGR